MSIAVVFVFLKCCRANHNGRLANRKNARLFGRREPWWPTLWAQRFVLDVGGMERSSAAGIPTVRIQSGDIRTTATSLARSAGGMASFWFRETCDSVAAKT